MYFVCVQTHTNFMSDCKLIIKKFLIICERSFFSLMKSSSIPKSKRKERKISKVTWLFQPCVNLPINGIWLLTCKQVSVKMKAVTYCFEQPLSRTKLIKEQISNARNLFILLKNTCIFKLLLFVWCKWKNNCTEL